MNIITSKPSFNRLTNFGTGVTLGEAQAQTPKVAQDIFKTTVTKAAYAGGGALGGLALGAVSGQVMTHLTQNPIFSTLGGGVGAVGGAATSLALAVSDQPVHMGRVFGSWAGASAGATGGMYAMQEFGKFLGSHGAATYFPSHGALIGAAGAGLVGAGIAFAGDSTTIGKAVRATGKAAAGGLIGLAAGGALQAALATHAPALAQLSAPTPFVLAGALALMGVQNDVNRGWIDGYRYSPKSKNLDAATRSVLSGTLGYGVGTALAAGALSLGASPVYAFLAPSLGAAVGAAGGFGITTDNQTVKDLSLAAGLAGGMAVVGDGVGHGLSALTGLPVFRVAGAAIGALAGGSAVLDEQGRLPRYLAPATIGFTAGATAGTLLGAGLTALTGHSAYQIAGTAIGTVAGILVGLAGRAHAPAKRPEAPAPEAANP